MVKFRFGHIFTKNYGKIKSGLYFACSSLNLLAFTILYFSHITLNKSSFFGITFLRIV